MVNKKIPDQGSMPPMPEKRPLQFKRGTDRAFRKANPVLLNGEPAWEWNTQKLKIGDGVHRYTELPYVTGGADGKSAYQLWLDAGNSGTVEDFLESLIGEPGKSTYEIWLSVGHEGTVVDFIDSLKGDSAYEVWRKQPGHEHMTEDDYNAYNRTMSWSPIEGETE